MKSDWLAEAVATRDIERVKANLGAAGERVNDARRHIRSARLLAEDDTTLAMAACHDAIRKSAAAHMAANGLRTRGGDGAHRIALGYLRHALAGKIANEDLVEADEIRQDRALAEYGDFASKRLDAAHVLAAADVAERIVNAIANALASETS
ncbi:MAG: HEPN domain-containing protein [Acidimicrobiia bacterium]|nr:HEPN domain-containing protein [Acidimicrobiia bacterium]MYG57450.1 HEPN domain-containing protein [Acidimicrobiia bacterium]MYJ31791.1 HEPN domain-containing protein [Acidimicrobiia bacterium]